MRWGNWLHSPLMGVVICSLIPGRNDIMEICSCINVAQLVYVGGWWFQREVGWFSCGRWWSDPQWFQNLGKNLLKSAFFTCGNTSSFQFPPMDKTTCWISCETCWSSLKVRQSFCLLPGGHVTAGNLPGASSFGHISFCGWVLSASFLPYFSHLTASGAAVVGQLNSRCCN